MISTESAIPVGNSIRSSLISRANERVEIGGETHEEEVSSSLGLGLQRGCFEEKRRKKIQLERGSQSCELDVEVDVLQNGMDSVKDLCSKKRARLESSSGLGTKACREKMRRDMLNERFTELYSILEPGISQNSNKVAILRHATHHLNHLRLEAKELKDKNKLLQETINSLKNYAVRFRARFLGPVLDGVTGVHATHARSRGVACLTRPMAILAAVLTALSIAFLNDRPVIRGRPSSKKSVYICGKPRGVFVFLFSAASFILWFTSGTLMFVLWAFGISLLVTVLHASVRTPNLKARLNTFREEFRAVWRNYSEL
ncbi:hypothetical protein GH714_011577 [Hevea brasiliensis]|uniref:BHLH domain-containing protein n=1 Tax=Hevea brasiliensis TaxID=3981 RepID=A0A6A6N221_HEVBR|nr:hypothetical protein GH714_011577 [Hevea brasiliensis]